MFLRYLVQNCVQFCGEKKAYENDTKMDLLTSETGSSMWYIVEQNQKQSHFVFFCNFDRKQCDEVPFLLLYKSIEVRWQDKSFRYLILLQEKLFRTNFPQHLWKNIGIPTIRDAKHSSEIDKVNLYISIIDILPHFEYKTISTCIFWDLRMACA